jgi:ABC-type branched-subunit amino acid transport system substrate-binding protein
VKNRLVAMTVAGAVLLSACGSRAADQNAGSANADLNNASQVAASGSTPPGGASTGDANKFGTLDSPCGPGNAKGATDTGVTDTELRIGVVNDETGPKPGLDKGMHDSMIAFVDWCNGQGGINGRQIKLDHLDAQLLNYQAKVKEACDTELAMVGGLAALDNTGAQDGVDCGLVNVPGAADSPEQTEAENTVQPVPNPIYRYNVGSDKWLMQNYPDAVKNAGVIWSNFPAVEQQAQRQMEARQKIGFNFTYTNKSNVNESNWAPLVLDAKNKGVQFMTLVSSFEEVVPMQASMDQQGFKPQVMALETNYYDQQYPDNAGATANGTFVRLTGWPIEEADKRPAEAKYLELLKKSVPDAQPALLGQQAFSAGLLWATAVKSLGSNVTRPALLAALKNIHQWDGGGLHGVTDPGANLPSTCFIMLQVQDGKFVRRFPLPDKDADIYKAGNGMSCPPPDQGLVTLTGDYGHGATKK